MTSIPGPTPGSSDSPEPEDGDSPTAGAHDSSSADSSPAAGDAADATPETVAAGSSGWAQQQPPPVQGWARWTPPAGAQPPYQAQPPHPAQQPPYDGPRWGPTAGGWQPPAGMGWGHQVPTAPKPGVIPLRPLGIGEILDGAIGTLRRHWRAVIGTVLGVGVVTQTASVVFQHQFIDTNSLNDLQDNPDPSASDIMHAVGGSLAASGLTILITMIGTMVATSMLTVVVSRAVLGRNVDASEAWNAARPQLPRLLGLTFLQPLLLCLVIGVAVLPGLLVALAGSDGGGAALAMLGVLAGSVVTLWLYIQWSLASPALMLEKQGVVASIKRSTKLVRGSWWRIFGVQIVSLILVLIASSIIELPFTLIGAAVTGDSVTSLFSADNASNWTYLIVVAIGGVIASTITLPIGAGVTTLLYMDQRIRRESLDLELIRATEGK